MHLFAVWVFDPQRKRVQSQAPEAKHRRTARRVKTVAYYWMLDRGKMHADLMRPAGFGKNFDIRRAGTVFYAAIHCYGIANSAVRRARAARPEAPARAAYGLVYYSALVFQISIYASTIYFLHFPVLKLLLQKFERLFRTRHRQNPARFPVYAMHDVKLPESFCEPVLQGFALRMPVSHHLQTGWLVYNNYLVVFKNNRRFHVMHPPIRHLRFQLGAGSPKPRMQKRHLD